MAIGDRPVFFMHAIRYLCKCKKERSTDHIKNIIMKEFEAGYVPEIPDYAMDMHTIKGKSNGRDVFYFLNEGEQCYGRIMMILIVRPCTRCCEEEAKKKRRRVNRRKRNESYWHYY